MVSRLQEKIDLGEFELGDVYKKGRIAQLGGVNPLKNNREWQGLVEFSNAFLAFVNLEKDAVVLSLYSLMKHNFLQQNHFHL